MIVGTDLFINHIMEELSLLGFDNIVHLKEIYSLSKQPASGILITYNGARLTGLDDSISIPVIYPFDFIDGAGAVVLFPGDDRNWLKMKNIRLWVAEYISGYCAFWNIEGCDWLQDALPAIKENRKNIAAMKTAAYMCARIAANIAVGRDVKRYPRFYLCRNLE